MEHLTFMAGDWPRERTATFADRLARAGCGDRSAVSGFLAENRSWLRRKASRLLSRRATQHVDSSDLAQKALADAAKHLSQFRDNKVAAFRVWLRTILLNNVRAFLRRNRRRLQRQLRLTENNDELLPLAEPVTTALDRMQREEELAQLGAALDELEEDDRQVIMARYVDKIEYSQLAEKFAMSEAAVRQKAHRAVAKLERAMRLLAAMHRKHMPPHYRRVLCAVRLRKWSAARIASEWGLAESSVRGLLKSAEVWMPTGDKR
jgi:RNA polymerase sigma-70 factor (ECF subfamily)